MDYKANLEHASTVMQRHKIGLQYQKQMGFSKDWPEYERFKAGNQWPDPTPKTRNLPRPVFNIIDRIESHKISSVMNEQVKLVFTAEDADDNAEDMKAAADLFTRYADTTWEKIKQNELNEEALEDASNRGTGIIHYYYDAKATGGNITAWQGITRGEVIDPINIFFGNPQEKNAQKQPDIVISSREMVSAVKDEAKANKVPIDLIQQIKPDKDTEDEGYDSAKVELSDAEKVTVLTEYKRKNGTIWLSKVASGITIKPPIDTGMKLYPIAVLPWKRRKKSIFGVGDTEGLIPNQKGINFLMAMQLLSVQNTGWPKMLLKKDFIRQEITNTPGEILLDNGPPGTWNAQYMNPGAPSPHAQLLVDKFMEYTKEVSGATEEALGESTSSDMNATAIMLRQKASGVPIEAIKRRFYQFVEDVGRIWEEFWKVKYVTERLVSIKDDEGNSEPAPFRGSDYANIDMNLKIDVGPSSSYSETLMMSSLDKFLEKKYITFDDYLEFAPKNVVPFKDRLKKRLEERQEQQAEQMANQGVDPNQVLSQLSPDEQQAFMQMPPDQQQAMLAEITGGGGMSGQMG